MFRMLRLKPPQSWNAVAWELGIVTLGVLIALAAQQWADQRGAEARTRLALVGIRDELANHYRSSIEWRVVEPCIIAQIDQLTARVLKSGATLDPAPIEREGDNFHFVLRTPSKEYPRSSWDAATNEGLVARLDPTLRNELNALYAQIDELNAMGRNSQSDTLGLNELGQPLPLDPATRYAMIRQLQDIRGRAEYRDTISGQLISHMQSVHMLPPIEQARALTERFGTFKYCKVHGLPLRSFAAAMKAIPN